MNDRELQHTVLGTLELEPSIDATEIGVTVDGGVVTLRGDVKTFREKEIAERVAFRVYGVRGVANDLRVRSADPDKRTDSAIAQAALAALNHCSAMPLDRMTVTVSDGVVVLGGEVDWPSEEEAAYRAVRDLLGVTGVTSRVKVKPKVRAGHVRAAIEAALERDVNVDAKGIHVDVHDGHVTLTGNVRSWAERQQVERAARSAPGVTHVEDRVQIVP